VEETDMEKEIQAVESKIEKDKEEKELEAANYEPTKNSELENQVKEGIERLIEVVKDTKKENEYESKLDDNKKLTKQQEDSIINGIFEKIEMDNREKLDDNLKNEIRKQVSDILKAENIKDFKSEANRIMEKVFTKIKNVDEKRVPVGVEPKKDGRTYKEVLAQSPTPTQASMEAIAKVVMSYLNKESSETCNKYISTVPKADCSIAHKNLYGVMIAKGIDVEPIVIPEQKERMEKININSWYFISKPYKEENLEKEVEETE